jgi:hypothetical protein
LGVGLAASRYISELVTECHKNPVTWKEYSDKQHVKKMGMSFGTWNVKSLYKVGSVMTFAKEVSKHKLDFVRI